MNSSRSDYLICYDVNTTYTDGERRLRRIGKACQGFGQRVQYSVFECVLSDMLLDRLRTKLLDIMNMEEDSLRIYHLSAVGKKAEVYGRNTYVDFTGPLIT